MPVDPGQRCIGSISQWYYSPDSMICKPFIFGGCGGNSNRFTSESACLRECTAVDRRIEEVIESDLTQQICKYRCSMATLTLWSDSVGKLRTP